MKTVSFVPQGTFSLKVDPDLEAAAVLVAQARAGYELREGAYEIRDDVFGCDVLMRVDGVLVPHSEAWRHKLSEVREVIRLYQEIRP